MSTVVFKWNPSFSSYTSSRFLKDLFNASHSEADDRTSNWSVWDYDKVKDGDTFYMLKVGYGQTGIVMRGKVTSDAYQSSDWSGKGRVTFYVDYLPEIMINPDGFELLTSERLQKAIPDFDWYGGHSGLVLTEEQATKLDELWHEYYEQNREAFDKASDDNVFNAYAVDNYSAKLPYKVSVEDDYGGIHVFISFQVRSYEQAVKRKLSIYDYRRLLYLLHVNSRVGLMRTLLEQYPTIESLTAFCTMLFTQSVNFEATNTNISKDEDED